jgi:hypothetical protein
MLSNINGKLVQSSRKRKKEYMHKKDQKGKMIGFTKTRNQHGKQEKKSTHWTQMAQESRHHYGVHQSHRQCHHDARRYSKHSRGDAGNLGRNHPHIHIHPMRVVGRFDALVQEKRHLKRRIHRLQRKLWALNQELRACSFSQEQPRRRHLHRDRRPEQRIRAF